MKRLSASELALQLLSRPSYPNYDEILDCIRDDFKSRRFLSVYFRERREKIFKRREGDTRSQYLYFNFLSFRLERGTLSRFDNRHDVLEGFERDAKRKGVTQQHLHNLILFHSRDFESVEIRNIASLLFNFYVTSDVREQYHHNATERLIRTQRLDYFDLGEIIKRVRRAFKIDAFYFAVQRTDSQEAILPIDAESEFSLIPQYSFGDHTPFVASRTVMGRLQAAIKRNQHPSGRLRIGNKYSYYKIVPVYHYYADTDVHKRRPTTRTRPRLGFSIKRRPLGCLILASHEEIKRLCYSLTRELLSEYSGSQNLLTKLSIVNSLALERAEVQQRLQTNPLKNFFDYNRQLIRFSERIAHSLTHVTQAQLATIRLFNPLDGALEVLVTWPRKRNKSDPINREKIVVGDGRGSLNAFAFRTLRAGEHAYIPNLLAPFPPKPVDRGLRAILPASEGAVSELCLPIFKNGLCIGTIDLECTVEQAFDMNIQFCHQLSQMLGGFTEILDRSSDAGWLPRLSFFQFAAHRIEQVRREIIRHKRVHIDTLLTLMEDRLSPNYIEPHRQQGMRVTKFFSEVEKFIIGLDSTRSRSKDFFVREGSFPATIAARTAHSLQVILENIIENADEHDGFAGQLAIRCAPARDPETLDASVRALEIEYSARKARFNLTALSEVGIAPRWNAEGASYHLGMFLVGVHVRLLGGTIWFQRSANSSPGPAPSFRMLIQVPIPDEPTKIARPEIAEGDQN